LSVTVEQVRLFANKPKHWATPRALKRHIMPLHLPFDILYLIVQQAGIHSPYNPLNYKIDSGTLCSLCLTCTSLNDVATPFLYSSIILQTKRHIRSLARTARQNPDLLKTCHSLVLPKGALGVVDDLGDVLSSTPALRRCISLGWKSSLEPILQLLPAGDILELSCPELQISIIQKFHGFENLQRLALARIPFMFRSVVDALLSLRRLSHIADAHFNFVAMPDPAYKEGLIKVLKLEALKRMVFGWIPWRNREKELQRDECEAFHQQLKASLPRNDQPKMVFVMYGSRGDRMWIVDRILDGTIWEMEY
jgi:hypothetical protein